MSVVSEISSFVIVSLIGIVISQNEVTDDLTDFPPTLSGSQCFHVQGIPTLNLRCPGGQLLRVQHSFYGSPPNNTTCRYSGLEDHCIQLADMSENCMGRYVCTVHVSNPFLMNCRTYANYMQVNYTCIAKPRIFDMCQEHTMTSRHGFLSTPNYPDADYSPNQHCRCRLQTKDSGILLQILDFSINHTEPGVCNTDYLKISDWGTKCGYISSQRLPETLNFNRKQVFLEFKSDEQNQARGFWLEFNGSEGGKVKVTCTSQNLDDALETSTVNSVTTHGEGGHLDSLSEIDGDEYIDQSDMNIIEDDIAAGDGEITNQTTQDVTRDITTTHKNGNHDKETDENEISENKGMDLNDISDNFKYNIDEVEIITGVTVGVLILIAVIIIIVLVFRR